MLQYYDMGEAWMIHLSKGNWCWKSVSAAGKDKPGIGSTYEIYKNDEWIIDSKQR